MLGASLWGINPLFRVILLDYMTSSQIVLFEHLIISLFAIILASLLLKEKLPRRFGILFILALIGTYLLTFGFTFPIGHWSDFVQIGSLLALSAAGLWGDQR